MSKIFIRNRCRKRKVDSNTGKVVDIPEAEWVNDDLDNFEFILNHFIMNNGHDLIIQASGDEEDNDGEADCKIYWHETINEVDGDLFYVAGHYRYLFTIDEEGWGASHSNIQKCPDFEAINTIESKEFCDSLVSEFIYTGKSKHLQPDSREVPNLPNDYLFVPLQTEGDYVLKQHSPISILEFIHIVSNWAIARNQQLVFKHHPLGKYLFPDSISLLDNYIKKSKGLILEFDENIHTLISQSKGILTINSGVGFESLIHGKPVATFGDCDYKWVTFQTNAEKLDKAQEYLYNYTQSQKESAWKFVQYYYTKHTYDLRPLYFENSKKRLQKYLKEFLSNKLKTSKNKKILEDA